MLLIALTCLTCAIVQPLCSSVFGRQSMNMSVMLSLMCMHGEACQALLLKALHVVSGAMYAFGYVTWLGNRTSEQPCQHDWNVTLLQTVYVQTVQPIDPSMPM